MTDSFYFAEGIEGEGIDYSVLDAKSPEELTEEEKIALLGRPCLGQNPKIEIRIRESKEFKVGVESNIFTSLFLNIAYSRTLWTNSWPRPMQA